MPHERRAAMSWLDDVRVAGELVGRSTFSLSATQGTVELRRGRSIGFIAARLVVSLFLLPFLLAPLLLFFEPDIPRNMPAAVLFLLWYGTLGGFAALAGAFLFRWRTVRVDGDRGLIELRGAGRLLWLPRQVSVPLEAVRELELRLGPGELRPVPFIWRLTHVSRGERPRKLAIGATVEAIDRREEAVHLTARIARLMGWKSFELTRSDEQAAVVRFARSESELDDPRPIPPLEEVEHYGNHGEDPVAD